MTVVRSIRVDDEKLAALKRVAEEMGTNVNALINDMIDVVLDEGLDRASAMLEEAL